MYENLGIQGPILKDYLTAIGADALGQWPLPDPQSLWTQPDLPDRVAAVLAGGPRPWAYKDAKLALVWQVWADAFPDAKWVLVRRDPERIADSCLRATFMMRFNDRNGWLKWVREHEARFDAMKAAGLDLVEVWPDRFVVDPLAFRPVAEHCGLWFDSAHVAAATDPDQWHGGQTDAG